MFPIKLKKIKIKLQMFTEVEKRFLIEVFPFHKVML